MNERNLICEDGQGTAEYGLILVLISVGAILVMHAIGLSVGDLIADIGDAFS